MENYDEYLTGKNPILKVILERLVKVLDEVTGGQYTIEKKKSSLHVVAKSAFLGVHFMKDKLRINIVLDSQINHQLLHKSEQISANRFHNKVDIDSPDKLDKQIQAFISSAYILKK